MLPKEIEARAKIQAAVRLQIEEMQRMLALALSLVPEGRGWKITKTKGVDRTVYLLVLALYTKALKTFRAIQIVCDGGLGQDAIGLLRVSFETTLGILFVLQRNSRLRARMYILHPASKRLQVLRSWKSLKGFKRRAPKALIRKAEEPLRDAVRALTTLRRWPRKHHYGNQIQAAFVSLAAAIRAGHDVKAAEDAAVEAIFKATKPHWSGKSIEEAAKAVGWHSTYETLYRYASPFTHAGDVEQHLTYANGGGVAMKLIPGDQDLDCTMETASLMLWAIMDRINKRFGLGHDAAIGSGKPEMLLRKERTRLQKKQSSRTVGTT